MTNEEKESLALIAYRLGLVENGIAEVKEDTKQVGQILGKLRLDEQVLSDLQVQTKRIESSMKVMGEKQDDRIKVIENIVIPNHTSWTETSDNQKQLLLRIAMLVIGSSAGLGTILSFLN